jgi:hypothetical protein
MTKDNDMTKETKNTVDPRDIRINELEARVEFIESHIALLMKDREASIRLLHGRMNNEIGLQKLINGWKDEV